MAHRRAKQIENLALVGVCSIHVRIFDLEHVKVIWGHSVLFFGNLGLGGVCSMHVVIFDLEHVKVIWGFFFLVHFSVDWAVTQKWLTVERNGSKFGPWQCM